jgi:hypothetical protein
VEFFESHSGKFCPECKICRTKLSSQKVEPNCQVKLTCRSCLKSHSRRAGRAVLVAPRQLSKTNSVKLSRRAISSEFVCQIWSKFSMPKFLSGRISFQRTQNCRNILFVCRLPRLFLLYALTLAIWPEGDFEELHYQVTKHLMRAMNFVNHQDPFWLYCVLGVRAFFHFSSLNSPVLFYQILHESVHMEIPLIYNQQ